MKPPLKVEMVTLNFGPSYRLRDKQHGLIAQYLTKADAELIAALVNKDFSAWQSRRHGLSAMTDLNEVEAGRGDDGDD